MKYRLQQPTSRLSINLITGDGSFMHYRTHRFIIIIALLFGVLLPGCGRKTSEEETTSSSRGIEVELISPELKQMTEYVSLNATTNFQNQEIVRASFAGYIVKSYKIPGDHIKKGEVLFLIKTREASAADTMSINYGAGEFSGLVKVLARTSGVLNELNFQAGNYVTDGDKLALIVEPQSLKIMLNVPYQYARLISASGLYSFTVPGGSEHKARVIKKMLSIDPVNQTQTFILEPAGTTDLPANLNINVKVPVKSTPETMVLPKSAVIANETQTQFWVMKAVNDSTAVKVDIQKGIETDSLVQIVQPSLSTKDRFILEGAYGMPDTAKILIKK